MNPTIRTWPSLEIENPTISGFAGFKAGSMHVISIDDREKTPNFGKPLFNSATVVSTPPIMIFGFRAYTKDLNGLQAFQDVYTQNLSKDFMKINTIKPESNKKAVKLIEDNIEKITHFRALAYVLPKNARLSQKKHLIFEIGVCGGDIHKQFKYMQTILGKEIRSADILKSGMYADVIAISKGKGFEGPVSRLGVKRKSHKSRKSVRAVGVLNPWKPTTIMYTVPRAGQKGFHQRVEYNKRIIVSGNTNDQPIVPKGGFPHFGIVEGDFIILKGSIPGPPKRFVKIRLPLRPPTTKIQPVKLIELSVKR
jgi:large subunit ribosomal protein L3